MCSATSACRAVTRVTVRHAAASVRSGLLAPMRVERRGDLVDLLACSAARDGAELIGALGEKSLDRFRSVTTMLP